LETKQKNYRYGIQWIITASKIPEKKIKGLINFIHRQWWRFFICALQ